MERNSPAVVVTGFGAVTPLGMDFAATWRRLLAGEDAAAPLTLFDVSGCRCKNGAVAQLPDLPQIPSVRLRRFTRATRLVLPAAIEALRHARLLDGNDRCELPWLPISVSTTGGGMTLGEAFLRAVREQAGPKNQFYRVARYSAQQQLLDLHETLGFRGPLTIIANACASGANAVGHARDLIRAGECDLVLSGGYESLTELIYVGFDCLQALSPERCRPFDKQRSGLMLGEAAAFLVLESETHARARGAEILAVLAGYGHGTDLHHLTQPQPAGQTQVRVIGRALADAGLAPADIAYLNAHGTGTPLNDASECSAFSAAFRADNPLRISSTKAAIGHTLGAAGAIEALFALAALRTGELPPQINVQQPEEAVAGKLVTLGERVANARATMSVNLGFGGSNAALVFRRYEDRPATVGAVSNRDRPALDGIAVGNRSHGDKPEPAAHLHPAIVGCGAVTAAGIGVEPLMRDQPKPTPTETYGGHASQAYRVNQQQARLVQWQQHPRLRRASAIALFMVEAAHQALTEAGAVDANRLGIVAAFGSGALISSRRFYEGILKSGQRFASPNLFPETVYNSATSHVAAVLGAGGPAYSLVGDGSAWVNAVGVARRWLADGLVEHALVIGAEELDPLILDVYRTARWAHPTKPFVAGEGAAALLLRQAPTGEAVRIAGLTEGWTYRSRAQARQAARAALTALGPVHHLLRTAAHTEFAVVENELAAELERRTLPVATYCGEAFAATAAWQTVQAVGLVRQGYSPLAVPIWGTNEQCAGLVLSGS